MGIEPGVQAPLISCVMPTYGRPDFLAESVGMFLAQDYPQKELVILNDCPGQVFNCEAEGVRVLNVKERFQTLGEKRNAAIQLARGSWISVWDDDDVYLPWHLSHAMERIAQEATAFYRPAEFWAYWDEVRLQDNQAVPGWVNHAIVVFEKRLWQDAGGYPAKNVGEDAAFFSKVHQFLGQDFIKHPVQKHDRSFILRGKSAYRHSCMPGGKGALDTSAGVYWIEPSKISDSALRQFHDELIEVRTDTGGKQAEGVDSSTIDIQCQSLETPLPVPRMSVCIAIKNRSRLAHGDGVRELFPRCVQALAEAAEECGPLELVVADYNSADWPLETWLYQQAGALQVQLLQIKGDFSRGGGLNAAAKAARSDRLFLCDADILVDTYVLTKGQAILGRGKAWFPICQCLDALGQPDGWQNFGYGLAFVNKEMFKSASGVPAFKSWGGEDDLFYSRVKSCTDIVRDREPGLRHLWHGEASRHEHYSRPRKSDYECLIVKPGPVKPGARFTKPAVRATVRQVIAEFYRQFVPEGTRHDLQEPPPVFPAYGTLLGMMREGDVIAHDSDVDFGCLSWPQRLPAETGTQLGAFMLIHRFHHHTSLCELVFRHETGVKVDLFLLDVVRRWRRVASFPDEFPNHTTMLEYFPEEFFQAWDTFECWGEHYQVPAQPERLLTAMYGSDWAAPAPQWSFWERNIAVSIPELTAGQGLTNGAVQAQALKVCASCPELAAVKRRSVRCRAVGYSAISPERDDCPRGRWSRPDRGRWPAEESREGGVDDVLCSLSKPPVLSRGTPRIPKVLTPWDFDRSQLRPASRTDGISAFMRLRNEEEYVRLAIESHLPYFDEIVAVYNRCTDRTPEILSELSRRYPDKIKVIHYEPHVYPQGSTAFKNLPDDSPNSLTNYYNFALMKTTCRIAIKLDGDHVAIPQTLGPFIDRIRREGLDCCRSFPGVNLTYLPGGETGVDASSPTTANDTAVFPVNPDVYHHSTWPYESLGWRGHLRGDHTSVPLFYHCKYLKTDHGFSNYDLGNDSESFYWKHYKEFQDGPAPYDLERFFESRGWTDLPHPGTLGIA